MAEGDLPRKTVVLVALIGLAGTLAGALIGGGISWWTTKSSADREEERQQDAEDALAQGTARIMVESFDNAVRRLCKLGKGRYFLNAPVRLRSEVTGNDRRLVAARLTPLQWQQVAAADLEMDVWEAFYRSPEYKRVSIDPVDWGIGTAITYARTAREALEEVADYPEDAKAETCNRKAWERDPGGKPPPGGRAPSCELPPGFEARSGVGPPPGCEPRREPRP